MNTAFESEVLEALSMFTDALMSGKPLRRSCPHSWWSQTPMPQDNVRPCDKCAGTGEIRVRFMVRLAYQDCNEWKGPFPTLAEAQAYADAGNARNPHRNPWFEVVEQEVT